MTELRKPSLSSSWQDTLNNLMEKHYPDVIGNWHLVDAWKQDGWNDGTTTLFGVYQFGTQFRRCSFPDFDKPSMTSVYPRFEHTGWDTPSEIDAY